MKLGDLVGTVLIKMYQIFMSKFWSEPYSFGIHSRIWVPWWVTGLQWPTRNHWFGNKQMNFNNHILSAHLMLVHKHSLKYISYYNTKKYFFDFSQALGMLTLQPGRKYYCKYWNNKLRVILTFLQKNKQKDKFNLQNLKLSQFVWIFKVKHVQDVCLNDFSIDKILTKKNTDKTRTK
jgi:hypothetical protein